MSVKQDLIRQARQTSLVAYLMSRGEPLKRIGKNYVHKEHDSLYIKDNMFVWYSRDRKGNSIDFLMLFYGMTFRQAVEELTGTSLSVLSEPQQERPQFRQKTGNERRVIAYLCKRRGIESRIVFNLIAQGKLYQDSNGNCNFVIADWNEQTIGAEIVGTGDIRYKQITVHSGYGFHLTYGEPTEALYFESAIDLLSCYQIFKDKFTHHILISLGGLNSSIIFELQRQRPSLNHWLCIDNDTAGTNFINEMTKQIRFLHIFRPPKQYKDWNEYLMSKK